MVKNHEFAGISWPDGAENHSRPSASACILILAMEATTRRTTMTKTEKRLILAGAICHHLKGRGLWHPDRRDELETKMSEVCQQIMDDSPAGRDETIAAATARDLWENDISGRGWATVRREVIRRLEILG